MESMEVTVGTSPGATDVLDWSVVPNLGTRVQVALPVQQEGLVLFFGARATNTLGMQSAAWSDGVRMVCSPARPGCTYDGYFLCGV